MTKEKPAPIEALQKADDGNFLRSLAEAVLQILVVPVHGFETSRLHHAATATAT